MSPGSAGDDAAVLAEIGTNAPAREKSVHWDQSVIQRRHPPSDDGLEQVRRQGHDRKGRLDLEARGAEQPLPLSRPVALELLPRIAVRAVGLGHRKVRIRASEAAQG